MSIRRTAACGSGCTRKGGRRDDMPCHGPANETHVDRQGSHRARKGGALIIYEFLIDDARRTQLPGFLMSLNMLIETKGGFDYTGADCVGWTRDAGFSGSRVVPLVGPHSAVIATK